LIELELCGAAQKLDAVYAMAVAIFGNPFDEFLIEGYSEHSFMFRSLVWHRSIMILHGALHLQEKNIAFKI